LAGVAVVHVTGVVQLAAPITSAEEVWSRESSVAGFLQPRCVWGGFPMAEVLPFQRWLVAIPSDDSDLEVPAVGILLTAEEVG